MRKVPRRKVKHAWTRAFFDGEPQPWHFGVVIFTALVIVFYFILAFGLPTLLLT